MIIEGTGYVVDRSELEAMKSDLHRFDPAALGYPRPRPEGKWQNGHPRAARVVLCSPRLLKQAPINVTLLRKAMMLRYSILELPWRPSNAVERANAEHFYQLFFNEAELARRVSQVCKICCHRSRDIPKYSMTTIYGVADRLKNK